MTNVLILGAGAIGKAVAGHIFTKLGCGVTFADIAPAVVADLQRRGGYVVHEAVTGQPTRTERVSGVRAELLTSPELPGLAQGADIICVAVGPKGFPSVLSSLSDWLLRRTRPLLLLLMENDAHCDVTAKTRFAERWGCLPQWLTVAKTSVERMSRMICDGDEYDVLCERFIPLIVPADCLAGTVMENRPDCIQPVADVMAYYERKLFTNNLGHAAIGYFGTELGCDNAAQAAAVPEIAELLSCVLQESGDMLMLRYPELRDSIPQHLAELALRYLNADMSDSLPRLCRDPVRKIGRDERIVGAILRCAEYGLPFANIARVLFSALRYRDGGDERIVGLMRTLTDGGIEAVLTDYCGIPSDERPFTELCRLYRENIQ